MRMKGGKSIYFIKYGARFVLSEGYKYNEDGEAANKTRTISKARIFVNLESY